MSLPKIDLPLYVVKLPSNGKTVKIRPFLVKEEKLLLMALESGDDREIIDTTKQVINNCLIDSDINIDKLPFFDVDYLFIALRAKSVGESIEVKYTCNNIVENRSCNNVFPAQIDISNCVLTNDGEISNPILLGNNIQVKMKYPNYTTMKLLLDSGSVIDTKINIIANSIDQIVNGDTVHTSKDLTKEDIVGFIENLTKQQYDKLEHFANNFPSFVIKSKAVCTKCGFEHDLTYTDFTSFFV